MLTARANDFLCLGFAYFKFTVCLINRSAVYALQSIKKRRKWGSCHVHICFISNVWINGSGSCLVVPSVNKNWRDEKARRQIENLRIFFFSCFYWIWFHCFCDFYIFCSHGYLSEFIACTWSSPVKNYTITHTYYHIYMCPGELCLNFFSFWGKKTKR